jgi:pilus assembly protein CpaC
MTMVVLAPAGHAQRVVPLSSEEGADVTADMAASSVPESVTIAFTKAKAIDLPVPIRDIIVANPAIADVVVQTPTQVFLIGHGTGATNIFFVGHDGNIVKHLVVNVEADLDAARAALQAVVPDGHIELRNVNGNVVMSGTVRSAEDALDAAHVVSRYVEYGDGSGGARVINMLRINEDQQVLLQVHVSEMARTVLKTLGFNTNFDQALDAPKNLAFTTAILPSVTIPAIGAGTVLIDELGFGAVNFAALERQGLTKTLAEPTLTAISGETANFLAGGEVPVPSSIGLAGAVSFDFRQFGIVLSFTPVVLSEDQISIRVVVEVSQLAPALTNAVSGIPGFTTRRAETTVTLPSGGSVMLAGLVQNDEFNTIDGVPGLKDLPIIGALFRSASYQRNETELVMIVTPYSIGSVDASEQLSMPTDGFVPAGEADMYLFGRLHQQYSNRSAPLGVPSIFGPIGYSME